MKKKSAPRPRKVKGKPEGVKCPYFSKNSRICGMMVEKGLDGRVSSFDIEHFCRGNPFHCYYFRSRPPKR